MTLAVDTGREHQTLSPASSNEGGRALTGSTLTSGYKVQTEPWQGLAPCRFHALAGALGRLSRALL
jgi:hypothetical protein